MTDLTSDTNKLDPVRAPNKMRGEADRLESFLNRTGSKRGTAVTLKDGSKAGPGSAFPSQLASTDPRDPKYQLRRQIIGEGDEGMSIPGVGQVQAPEDYFDYALDKHKQMQVADFKNWMLSTVVDIHSPAEQAYWMNNFPDLFNDKMELAKNQAEMQLRLQKIAVIGPKDVDDYYLLWAIQRGYVEVPNAPLWDPKSVPNDADFTRSVFNLRRFFPQTSNGKYEMSSSIFNFANPIQGPGATGTKTGYDPTFRKLNNSQGIRAFMNPGA